MDVKFGTRYNISFWSVKIQIAGTPVLLFVQKRRHLLGSHYHSRPKPQLCAVFPFERDNQEESEEDDIDKSTYIQSCAELGQATGGRQKR